jgi:endonuclease/exonuclease/phosphatase (EEP) superfamily protein YafD
MKKFLFGFTIFLLMLTMLPFLPFQHGWIRIWSFPRLQITVLMIATLIGWGFYYRNIKRYKILVGALLIAACYQASKFIPYTFLWKPQVVNTQKSDRKNQLSILCYNVYMYNKEVAPFLNVVNSTNADVIILAETDEYWRTKMQPLYKSYPYKVEVPLNNTYGMCLYSKLPLSSTQVKYLVEPDIPSIHTNVTLPSGQQVKLYCIHPEPPTLSKSTTDRDAELIIVAKEIANEPLPVIVAGDLNDVAWSSTTNLFGELSKCNDPRVGRGLFSTFNAKYPLLRWPLDHFFTSIEFTLNSIKRLPFSGSDHFPIFISVTYDAASAGKNKSKDAEKADLEEANDKLRQEKKDNRKN